MEFQSNWMADPVCDHNVKAFYLHVLLTRDIKSTFMKECARIGGGEVWASMWQALFEVLK